jgi:hypothetical protein
MSFPLHLLRSGGRVEPGPGSGGGQLHVGVGKDPVIAKPAAEQAGRHDGHALGGEVSGFRERRWKTVQQIKPGDYLLCCLTGISR